MLENKGRERGNKNISNVGQILFAQGFFSAEALTVSTQHSQATKNKMSPDARKTVFGIADQVQRKLAYIVTENG